MVLGKKNEIYKIGAKKIPESLSLILVVRYKNQPNPILTKLEIVITFTLFVRIGYILYGFGVEK